MRQLAPEMAPELMRQKAAYMAVRASIRLAAENHKRRIEYEQRKERSRVNKGYLFDEHVKSYRMLMFRISQRLKEMKKQSPDKYLMENVYTINTPKTPKLGFILAAIAEKYGLSIDSLKGASRSSCLTIPRQEFIFEATKTGRWSSSDIGRFLKRDHTTVLHAVNAHCYRNNIPHPVSGLMITKNTKGKFVTVKTPSTSLLEDRS